MLAKTESAEQVRALAPLDVVVLIETPLGALAVAELARRRQRVRRDVGRRGSVRRPRRHRQPVRRTAATAMSPRTCGRRRCWPPRRMGGWHWIRCTWTSRISTGCARRSTTRWRSVRRQGRHPPVAGGGHPRRLRADPRPGRLGATRAGGGPRSAGRLPIRGLDGRCPSASARRTDRRVRAEGSWLGASHPGDAGRLTVAWGAVGAWWRIRGCHRMISAGIWAASTVMRPLA